MLKNSSQETMLVLLPKVLCQVFVCASWNLWQQGGLSLLQQLENQKGRPQMPLKFVPLTRSRRSLKLIALQPLDVQCKHYMLLGGFFKKICY